MQISINLDDGPINVEEIKAIQYLSSIVFLFTVDTKLTEKLFKITPLLPFLASYPTITTKLKVVAIEQNPLKQYKVVAVGGTFDYLHIGHQILLLYTALAATQTVHIGVTGDALIGNKKYKELIQNLVLRMKNVQNFMKSVNKDLKLIIFELSDPLGPTVTLKELNCLVASPQTSSKITKLNQIRKENGLGQIDIIQCPLISPDNQIESKISTSCIKAQLYSKNQLTPEEFKQYKSWLYNLVQDLSVQNGLVLGIRQIWWDLLFTSYSQRWRYYHTNRHIYQILKQWNGPQFDQLRKKSLSLKDRVALQSALFFHDIVYKPGSPNNQKESAEICARFLRETIGESQTTQEVINEAKRLILQTEQHSKPTSRLSQIVYDLDMGILNDPAFYKQYAQGVRKEYEPLLKDQYPKKRSEFLQKTLKQERYFSNAATYVQQNIKWQLGMLKSHEL